MLDADEKELATMILSAVLSDETLSTPAYVGWVESEDHAAAHADHLPLVYVWNENPATGGFSVSVNGRIVGAILERVVDRASPSFRRLFDEICHAISKAASGAIVSTCEAAGAPPSKVFPL